MICIVPAMPEAGLLRIGELSRRAGVSPELLRAWERRYGLLRPTRTPGGLRLYSSEDLRRVQEMQRHLSDGVAAAEAAALASQAPVEPENASLTAADVRAELAQALDGLDEPAAQAILDRLFAVGTVEAALSDVILPYLRELGARAQEEKPLRGEMARLPRSTSRRTCCAVVCSASRAVGVAASGRSRCSRACRESSTSSGSSRSGSRSARTVGASPTSAATRRSRRLRAPRSTWSHV